MTAESLNEIIAFLRGAGSVAVLTGAGVSAESGIATFRDALTGLWARYDPHELATPEAFARNPELVARWYDERRSRCAACLPNAGHRALVELERRFAREGRRFTLLSQNVDRLHHRAGSENVVELHGTLWVWRCIGCGKAAEELKVPFPEYPPRCGCGGMRRPGVVWFGEMLPERALAIAQEALASCEVFLSLGTSAVVEPAANFVHLAKRSGARTVEINLDITPISPVVDYSVRGKTGEVLPRIVAAL